MKNDGGPAFPCPGDSNGFDGMTLRDWFAGQALAGMLGHPAMVRPDDALPNHCAKVAYHIADAMLAARAQEKEDPNA